MRAFGDKKKGGKNAEDGTTETMTANSRLELGWGWSLQGVADCHWRVVPGLGVHRASCLAVVRFFPFARSPARQWHVVRWAVRRDLDQVLTLFFVCTGASVSLALLVNDRSLSPTDLCRVTNAELWWLLLASTFKTRKTRHSSAVHNDQNEFILSSLSLVYQIPHAVPPFPSCISSIPEFKL